MLNNLTRQQQNEKKIGLPELVSQWYYKHGLFLSSYPTCASSIAIIVILLSCYPLLNIPLPGTIPTRVIVPYTTAKDNDNAKIFEQNENRNFSLVKNILNINNLTFNPPFRWAKSRPYIYVQQIILRSSVTPWTNDLQLMDAYRAPLYEVFKLLEMIRNHEDLNSKNTFDHICLHVENVKRPEKEQIFPEYNCLILSPANFWRQDVQNFSKDFNILGTIFQHHNLQKSKISTAEMLFGLPIQDTGFKRYPLRSRSRIIQYAITLILRKNDQNYLDSLRKKLTKMYPLHQNEVNTEDKLNNPFVMYIYYPGEFKIMEFLPIFTAFIALFTYVYYSVRKIDMIRSRFVLALCAVLTVLGSLMMSLGLCFFFGLTISLQSKGIFPYLVILVGLENCLVITKSVVTTDETFDVKIRVAQALSKEGWHISKTLLTEITILTVGLATFVPVIQEFCIFAIVGLISDFFLQMLLFSTILAMDIKRIEYTAEAKHLPKIMNYAATTDGVKRKQYNFFGNNNLNFIPFKRSQSYPKLYGIDGTNQTGSHSGTRLNNSNPEKRIPKRLKLVNFWARTRFFQRAFMIWMSVWIFSIIYNSGFLENIFIMDTNGKNHDNQHHKEEKMIKPKKNYDFGMLNVPNPINNNNNNNNNKLMDDISNITEQLKKLQYPDFEINYYLSNFHWLTILKQYNISLSGKYVTILPAIKLSHIIKPEIAILLRNPKEKMQNFQWKALAAALDPLDFIDNGKRESLIVQPGGIPLYPKSPMEIFLTIMLCAISVFVLTYTMVVFYRCICTRNYAEWRSSWNDFETVQKNTECILEGVPIQVVGHKHKIECLVSDDNVVISSCLEGQIKVWDSKTGEVLTNIDRSNIMENLNIIRTKNFIEIERNNKSPIWCLDYLDNLIAVGCANGRLEFWETPTGYLKCTHIEESKRSNGITNIHLNGDRVIVARLSGRLEIYKLETFYKGKQIDWGFTSAYRRTHVRTGSMGSLHSIARENLNSSSQGTKEEMKCTLEETRLAHQQPITCMEVINGIIFLGSQDHTLKVYSLEDSKIDYSLHGHCGPITCLFVDHWQPGTGGSGSQDGLLCVWDLLTGACMYKIQAHDGSITALACAPSYVISLGTDERVCAWERFQGNLLSTINITNAYSSLLMLTPSLLVTSKTGSLMVWDVRTGEPTREVKLDCSNSQLCPKLMLLASSSVICDYGNQLRIVRFPMVADKCN